MRSKQQKLNHERYAMLLGVKLWQHTRGGAKRVGKKEDIYNLGDKLNTNGDLKLQKQQGTRIG